MDARILIVDDDERILKTFSRYLQTAGYEVLVAPGGAEGIRVFDEEHPDIVFTDVRMPAPGGFELLETIRGQVPDAEVVFVTGHSDMEMAIAALRAGASDFVTKPISPEELDAALHRACSRLTLKKELREAQEELSRHAAELEARNAELRDALDRVNTLSGLLPICSSCKKIRDDRGYWHQVEVYIQEHSGTEFSHGICPDCMRKLYPGLCDDED